MHGPPRSIWINKSIWSILKSYSVPQKGGGEEGGERKKKNITAFNYGKTKQEVLYHSLSKDGNIWRGFLSFFFIKSFSSVRFVKHNNLCMLQFTEVFCNSHCQIVEFITFCWNISIWVKCYFSNALLELVHEAVPFCVILGIYKQYDPSHSGLLQMFETFTML